MAGKKSQNNWLVLVPGIDNDPWQTHTFPEILAEARLDRDGGAKKADVMTGPPTAVPTFVATRPYRAGRDAAQIKKHQANAMTGNCERSPISVTSLDGNKVPDDSPMGFIAVILGMKGPDGDANSAANSMVSVTLGIESVA